MAIGSSGRCAAAHHARAAMRCRPPQPALRRAFGGGGLTALNRRQGLLPLRRATGAGRGGETSTSSPSSSSPKRPPSPNATRAAVPPRGVTAPGSGSTAPRGLAAQHLAMVLGSTAALAAASAAAAGGGGGPDVTFVAAHAAAGAALGAAYAAAHRHASVRLWRPPSAPLRMVITGGTRGLGKALAREALLAGDAVVVTGRRQGDADAAAAELALEVAMLRAQQQSQSKQQQSTQQQQASIKAVPIYGIACDVSDAASVAALADAAPSLLGGEPDAWVLNAGQSGAFRPLLDAPDGAVEAVVRTNLLGALLCAREAARRMAAAPAGGHLFFMDGAGADGSPTPYYAAYGATKAALPQLAQTLRAELRGSYSSSLASPGAAPAPAPAPVGVHVLSPGMVLTELLLEGATDANKQIFNILCEHPETVAAFLVPRLRSAVARGAGATYTRYLTLWSALWRFASAPARAGRFFDADGAPTYAPERARVLGRGARAERKAAAARGGALRAAYSLSVAACAAAVVFAEAAAKAAGGS